jgi:hypothetical protein
MRDEDSDWKAAALEKARLLPATELRGDNAMCDKGEEIHRKIDHYRYLASHITESTVQRASACIDRRVGG